jgi:hypothetical protein
MPAAAAMALAAHTPIQVDPRASAALWAPDNSGLLLHRHPQLAIQCEEPAGTHK